MDIQDLRRSLRFFVRLEGSSRVFECLCGSGGDGLEPVESASFVALLGQCDLRDSLTTLDNI